MENSNSQNNRKENGRPVSSSSQKISSKETAQYISEMILELRNMAKAADLKPLKDLLELCFYEGFSAANRVQIPEGELEHLRELSNASKAN